MKISACNQFKGEIVAIENGSVSAQVTLDIGSGVTLVATVTRESITQLDLTVGCQALAFIKAFHVMLMACDSNLVLSARNQLAAEVVSIQSARINAEVLLSLVDDLRLKSIVTQEGLEELQLKEGDPVLAVFKASHLLLGRYKSM